MACLSPVIPQLVSSVVVIKAQVQKDEEALSWVVEEINKVIDDRQAEAVQE